MIKSAICESVLRSGAVSLAPALQAIVLTGSLARDEATFIAAPTGTRVAGDAEFVLVLGEGAAPPGPRELYRWRIEAEDALRRRGILCRLDISPVRPEYLRRLAPHIYAFELKTCGEVVWGNANVLKLIPGFAAGDIPAEDGWRTLCNRMVEVLEPGDGTEREYRIVKLCLDMATSLLVFAGRYAPTYRERCARLRALAEGQDADGWPFRLGDFADCVQGATLWKLSGSEGGGGAWRPSWPQTVEYARALCRWELIRMTGSASSVETGTLWDRWLRRQPVNGRVRGWGAVIRECGWYRSWRKWPRWARLALRGSPRYCVYRAASGVLFRDPAVQTGTGGAIPGGQQLHAIQRWLPAVPAKTAPHPDAWAGLAGDIVWNYRTFLVHTRA